MAGYTLFSYGDVDTLALIFNALAAMTGGSSMAGAIAMVLILGFFGALISMAVMKHLYGIHWLIAVFLINGVLLVPKTTVQIVDKTAMQAPVLVDNVPWGIGALASIVTSVGSGLTEMFETAFQVLPAALTGNSIVTLPADLTYEKTGMMFGATLIREAAKTRFQDPVFETDLVNFIANCTIYDISQGLIDANTFNNAKDLWPLMANTNQARFSTLHGANGAVDSYSCPVAYASLDAAMASQVTQQITNMAVFVNPALRANLGQSITPAMSSAAAADLDAQLMAAYNRSALGGAAASTAQIIRQHGLINAVNGAGAMFSQRTNDPSALMLGMAQSQTTAAHNAQKIVGGKIAESALPLLHNGITAIIYTAFPLVVLIALLLGGLGAIRVLKMYSLSLVWLAMWPPLYAVVNFLHSTKAAKATALAGYANSVQGVTLATAPSIYDTTMSELAITSWLLVSVPVIASAIVFGMDKLANAGIGFMTAMGTSASFGSRQAGDYAGNLSLDKMDLAPNYTSAFMSQYGNALGTSTSDLLSGDYRYRANLGQSAVSLGTTTEIGNRLSAASAKAERVATQETEAAQKADTATLAHVLGETHREGVDSTYGNGSRYGDNASLGTKIDKLHEIQDQLKRDLGITDSNTASSALNLALGAGYASDKGGRDKASSDVAKMLPINAKLGSEGTQLNTEQVKLALDKARTAAVKAGITDTRALTEEYVKTEDFQIRISKGDERARQIQASHLEALTHTDSAQKSHEQAQEYRQSAEKVMAMAARGEINWVPEFHNYARKHALNDSGEHGIRDMGELTGEKAAHWMNKFFSEGEMGRTLDGSPAWMEKAGFSPTRHPMSLEANSDVGARYEAIGTPTIDGQAVTTDRVREQNQADRTLVPGVAGYTDPDGKGKLLDSKVAKGKAANQSAEKAVEAEIGRKEKRLEEQYRSKANNQNWANEAFGTDGVVHAVKEGTKKPGATGKW